MANTIKHALVAFLLFTNLCGFAQLLVAPDSKAITYMGRVKVSPTSSSFYWPGSSATINFKGTGVKATLQTVSGKAFFYVIVDKDASKAVKISSDSLKTSYNLASNLPYGKHTVMLYKLTNNTTENLLYNFEIEGKGKIRSASKLPKRKIEFYGNSITAGHGVDVADGMKDSGAPPFFNNYHTYAALTASHFNAQYSCIARSGIGLMVSWFPEIMPEIYDRINPTDSTSKWDFNSNPADVVVVNLGQNDYWIVNMPENEQFKARFGTKKPTEEFIVQSYANFISKLRIKYPKAHIICALGSMNATETGSKWPDYIKQAIAGLDDDKVHSVFFPYKKINSHPRKKEQKEMADVLIDFIEKTVKW